MITIICLFFSLLLALQILDIITTSRAIDSGKAVEGNPIVKAMMRALGMLPALIISKTVTMSVLGSIAWFYPSWLLCGCLGVLILLYTWAVLGNWKLMRQP